MLIIELKKKKTLYQKFQCIFSLIRNRLPYFTFNYNFKSATTWLDPPPALTEASLCYKPFTIMINIRAYRKEILTIPTTYCRNVFPSSASTTLPCKKGQERQLWVKCFNIALLSSENESLVSRVRLIIRDIAARRFSCCLQQRDIKGL